MIFYDCKEGILFYFLWFSAFSIFRWNSTLQLEQRVCLSRLLRLRRSLAASSFYAEVRILPEAFLIHGNEISYELKKGQPLKSLQDFGTPLVQL